MAPDVMYMNEMYTYIGLISAIAYFPCIFICNECEHKNSEEAVPCILQAQVDQAQKKGKQSRSDSTASGVILMRNPVSWGTPTKIWYVIENPGFPGNPCRDLCYAEDQHGHVCSARVSFEASLC